MATTSTEIDIAFPDFEAAIARAREAHERLLEVGLRVSSVHLDGVEKYVASIARCE